MAEHFLKTYSIRPRLSENNQTDLRLDLNLEEYGYGPVAYAKHMQGRSLWGPQTEAVCVGRFRSQYSIEGNDFSIERQPPDLFLLLLCI